MSETIDHYVMDYSNNAESSYEWTFFKFAMKIANFGRQTGRFQQMGVKYAED